MMTQDPLSGRRPVFEYIQPNAMETFVCRLDDYPWRRNVWNFHPEYEIHLIRNASGVALIGDHIGRFEPGSLTVVGGGLPHDWVTDVRVGETIAGRDIVLQFDADRVLHASTYFPELAELEGFFSLALRGLEFRDATSRAGARLLEEINAARGARRLAFFFELLTLLSRSSEFVTLSSSDFAPNRDEGTLELVQRLHAYVFERLNTEIRLSEVAKFAGMGESAFSRFFKKNIGNTFTDHVTKLRLVRACELLADSKMPITSICFEVGYMNISNFNRLFRKERGITPSERAYKLSGIDEGTADAKRARDHP
jgi:AraC-like DNA-binding protein